MMKNKTNIIQNLTVLLATLVAFSVVLVSVHAKDVVRYGDAAVAQTVKHSDITDKVVKELHDHVDKQVLKNFNKVFSDNVIVTTRSREELSAAYEEDPGLWGRFTEHIMLLRAYVTLPFSAMWA